jgi:MoaA/NifB/PqqE/SkfB family radical SAM enzyme
MDHPGKHNKPVVDSPPPGAPERAADPAVREEPFGSKTFCILPWMHTFIDVNGEVKLCCIATEGLPSVKDGAALSLQKKPFREIWNSPEMKEVREKMLTGQEVESCRRCNKEDAMGQVSYRQNYNKYWLHDRQDGDQWVQRVEESMTKGYEVPLLPAYFDIRPGNLCTLKCRMCHSDYSNLIKDDVVHSKWAYHSEPTGQTRFSDGKEWYQAEEVVIAELLENVQETRMFYLAGGEPLVNPFVRRLIDTLIDRGVAGQVSIEISTNATVLPLPLVEKLGQFAHVRLFLSIDGHGPLYEYIRYPGKWDRVSKHLEEASRLSGWSCAVTTTVQNYNALALPEIFKVMEAIGLPCNFNLVYSPEYLSIRAMPGKARALAAQRLIDLREYAERSPMAKIQPGIVANISNVIIELEQESEHIYRRSIRDFNTFTNDLDKSRGQSFRDVCPELYELIVSDGHSWNDRLRYAD